MLDLIQQLSSDSQGGTLLVLAVVIFSLVQYLLNKKQTKELGGNHMGHLREDIFNKIDLHEQWKRESTREVVQTLSRMETTLIKIHTTLENQKRK